MIREKIAVTGDSKEIEKVYYYHKAFQMYGFHFHNLSVEHKDELINFYSTVIGREPPFILFHDDRNKEIIEMLFNYIEGVWGLSAFKKYYKTSFSYKFKKNFTG